MTWKPRKATKAERRKDRELQLQAQEALMQDAMAVARRGSGLPSDWRSRRLQGEGIIC